MTLVEFLHPLRGKSIREYCLAVLLYERTNNKLDVLTVKDIRARLSKAKVPRAGFANISDLLSKFAPYVHIHDTRGGSHRWALTKTGEERITAMLGLNDGSPNTKHDATSLESVIESISDKDVSEYIEEAVVCLRAGALRATVVFVWQGAVREIQTRALSYGADKVNAAVGRHDPKARKIKKLDDFAYVKESTLLIASQDLGIFDKNQKGTLEEALNLRNKSGHPGRYKPGANRVRGYIEDIVNIVFN